METKIKLVRNQGLDKFYTNSNYAEHCINSVFKLYNINSFDLIIEPSAGNGSFLNQLKTNNKIGIDIFPENKGIIKMNFFDYTPPKNKKFVLVIGNPPFGRISSTAVKFFNHASKFANVIAFIIPRTFRKISIQNKLNTTFHLVFDEDTSVTPCCFIPKMSVKCCFQIWEKQNCIRPIIKLTTHHLDWTFLPFGPKKDGQPTVPKDADFALRAYGSKIGEIKINNLQNLRPKSWHWIKSNIDKYELIKIFNQLDYSGSLNTARQNSMGRAELVKLYDEFIFKS